MRTVVGTIPASPASVAATSTNTVTVCPAPGESASESDASEKYCNLTSLPLYDLADCFLAHH